MVAVPGVALLACFVVFFFFFFFFFFFSPDVTIGDLRFVKWLIVK